MVIKKNMKGGSLAEFGLVAIAAYLLFGNNSKTKKNNSSNSVTKKNNSSNSVTKKIIRQII